MTPTYELAPNPPSGMSWQEYEQRVLHEWTALLDSPAGCDEKLIQKFLNKHPSMIPGASSMTGPSGHMPFPMAVLSESPLQGIGMRVPDFIWLAHDSATFKPVFIEIESPCKRWFTKKKVQTSDFSQALGQLGEWVGWLKRPQNLSVFYKSFKIPAYMEDLSFCPEFVLIYGRRKEFDDDPDLKDRRQQFEPQGQKVMTFDRLSPAHDRRLYLTATKTTGAYRALEVPATMALGPHVAKSLVLIERIPEAIEKNEWLSKERRRFLIDRLPYWNEWAKRSNHGFIHSGDWE